MFMYSALSWLTSASTENEKTLNRLRISGKKAFADQEALMLSWSQTPPPNSIHPAIIDLLIKNMKHEQTTLGYKLLCAIWISTLNPDKKHAERVAPLIRLLAIDKLENESHHLFQAFSHALSDAQWSSICTNMMNLLDPTKHATMEQEIQAIRILAVGYSHFNMIDGFVVIGDALQEKILETIYGQFDNRATDVHLAIAESLETIINSASEADRESIKQAIFDHCTEEQKSKNIYTQATANLCLSKIFLETNKPNNSSSVTNNILFAIANNRETIKIDADNITNTLCSTVAVFGAQTLLAVKPTLANANKSNLK